MKKLLCLALVAIMALSCAVLPAMAESHPLIYKVTDADGHYIYLLGTMHVVSKDTYPIANLDTVLKDVDNVVFEMDAANMEKIVTGNVSEGDLAGAGMKIEVKNNGLSDATLEKVANLINKTLILPLMNKDILRQMSLPVLTQMVAAQVMSSAGYDNSGHGVDVYVYKAAKKLDKKISGVETMEDQMKALTAETNSAAMDVATVEKNLAKTLDNMDAVKAELDSMVKAYNTGDKDTLLKLLLAEGARSSADGTRNARFLEVAEKALKDGGRTLIAIGAYHIIAEDGLANTLAKAGYTVTPV